MRRLLLVALLCAPSLALAQEGTAPDWADKSGAVGIGANTTLGGSNGVHIRTFVTPLLGIELTFGFAVLSQSAETDAGAGDTSLTQSIIDVGVYGSYKLAYWQRGHLSLVFGTDIASVSAKLDTPVGDYDDSATNLVVGLGLMGEYFPTQYLSLHLGTGIALDAIGDDDLSGRSVMTLDPSAADIQIDLFSDLWGAAGFTVWFN